MADFRGTVPAYAGSRPSHGRVHPSGRRIFKRARVRTKTEAKRKLKEIIRDYQDGLVSSITTEAVYRKQIRPVIAHGADVMVRIFPGEPIPYA